MKKKPGPKPYPVRIRGVDYPSAKEAAKALGIAESTMHDHLRQGQPDKAGAPRPPRDEWNNPRSVRITIGGIQYKSLKHAADSLGINYNKLRNLNTKARRKKDAME